MAGKPSDHPMATNADSATSHLGEPRFVEDMKLLDSGGSIRVSIPIAAVKFLGYQQGEYRAVEVYDDGIFIPREAPDE